MANKLDAIVKVATPHIFTTKLTEKLTDSGLTQLTDKLTDMRVFEQVAALTVEHALVAANKNGETIQYRGYS